MEFNPDANLVEFLFSPAAISPDIEQHAKALAERVVTTADFVGLLAIELFLTTDGSLLVNEMAPRPHNSGHHTIEGCTTSQYEQHLRAILNLPPGHTDLIQPAVMVNLLGAEGFSGPAHYEGLAEILSWPGVHVHLYGKTHTKPFRKMGHVTLLGEDIQEVKAKAQRIKELIKIKS